MLLIQSAIGQTLTDISAPLTGFHFSSYASQTKFINPFYLADNSPLSASVSETAVICAFCVPSNGKVIANETHLAMDEVYNKTGQNLDTRITLQKICEEAAITDPIIKKIMTTLLDPTWSATQVNAFLVDMKIDLFRNSITNEPLLMHIWKSFVNAPNGVRTSTTILDKANQLLLMGFTQSDLLLLATVLNKLQSRSVLNADIQKIAEYALEARKYTNQYSIYNIEVNLFKQLDELATTSRFQNIGELKAFLSEVQLLQNIKDNLGNLEQLNETVKILKAGNEVILEGKSTLKGDIVNVSKYESIQFKAVTGTAEGAMRDNLNSAANQFLTEPAASGYKKIAKVKILNNANPLYRSTTSELRIKLQTATDQNINQRNIVIVDNLRALDQIIIENMNGIHKFKLTNSLIVIIP